MNTPPPGKTSAWDSSIVQCKACAGAGCTYRVCQASGESYCCGRCEARNSGFAPALEEGALADAGGHDSECSQLEAAVLKRSWWESHRCCETAEHEAQCLVVPPTSFKESLKPAPVVLFLVGDGHVDARQDFLKGGVDLLLQNSDIYENCIVLAPLPMTASGLLRSNQGHWGHSRAWDEKCVWAVFTEVLRRLGPGLVDPSRLCATGVSLGAAGVWHLALLFGDKLAAAAPISGRCEWPANSWPWELRMPQDWALQRLRNLPLRAYQTDIDSYAGNPRSDIEWLARDLEEEVEELTLPGVDSGTECQVRRRAWRNTNGVVSLEFWQARGPLSDWCTSGQRQKFNDHLLYHRVYPMKDWKLGSFFLQHQVPEASRWTFEPAVDCSME